MREESQSICIPGTDRSRSAAAAGCGTPFDPLSGARWYVVHTQPSAEGRAIINLERQGYHVFCPRYRKTTRHARKSILAFAPLFPGYLFLKLDTRRDQWRSVNGTRGVVRLIAQGDDPRAVPCGIVEAMQAHTGDDGAIDWTPALGIGQAVRVSDGPFADFVGTLERLDGAGRVSVLFDFLGRSVSVTLRREALSPAA